MGCLFTTQKEESKIYPVVEDIDVDLNTVLGNTERENFQTYPKLTQVFWIQVLPSQNREHNQEQDRDVGSEEKNQKSD